MDISPENALIHRKAASFEHLVWTVSMLKGFHTSSKLINLMIHQLPLDTIPTLQESQSVSNYVQDWAISIVTLKLYASLDVNMYEVTKDMINEPAKKPHRIKLMIFCCTVKGIKFDSRISPGIAPSFKFFLRLPKHSWDPVSEEVQVLISPAKALHFTGYSMKFINSSTPLTPKRQTINFEKETDSSGSDNIRQPNNEVLAQTTNPSESAAFASTRMIQLFKKLEYIKNRILWATYIIGQSRIF